MQQEIEERGDPDHAAHIDEGSVTRNPPHRRDGERHKQQADRPRADLVDGLVHRARTKLLGKRVIPDDEERQHEQDQRSGP